VKRHPLQETEITLGDLSEQLAEARALTPTEGADEDREEETEPVEIEVAGKKKA
jgi:hypothetical protein